MDVATVFRRFPVELAYQFGSATAGKEGPMSDLDVAVLADPSVRESDYLKLQIELLQALDPVFDYRPVDLVLLNRAEPLLHYEVIRNGRLLFAKDDRARIGFEEKALREYLDTAYLRRVQDQALLARLKDGALGDPSRIYFG